MNKNKFKQTEIGKIPKDWEVKELKEISSRIGDGLHGTPKYSDGGDYYFINGNNLNKGSICFDEKTKKCSKTEFDKYKKDLDERTILVSINGTIGNIALYNNEKIILGKSACYLKIKADIDLLYVKYVLSNKKFQNYIKNNATGTTIKNVSLQQVREFKFGVPLDKEEQLAIASILSSLDAEIELNNKMNKTLEEIGQTIFKKWFIDNPEKENWEEGTINSLAVNKKNSIVDGPFGTQMKIAEYTKAGVPVIEMQYLEGKPFYKSFKNFISEKKYEEVKRSSVHPGDIIISKTGTLGLLGIMTPIYEKAIIVSRLAKISPNDYTRYFLFFLLKDLGEKRYWNQISSGSTMPLINLGHIKNYLVAIPPKNILGDFNKLIELIFKQISNNCFQSQALSQIRDSLLPKLMSGEIRVPLSN